MAARPISAPLSLNSAVVVPVAEEAPHEISMGSASAEVVSRSGTSSLKLRELPCAKS